MEPTCPKCNKKEDIKTTWVPLGHGRHALHACPRCRIIFEWGWSKFGEIEKVEQVKRYKELQENESIEDVKKGAGGWKRIN